MALIKKLRKKKKEAPANEKPDVVKTHLRNMVLNYTIFIPSILTVFKRARPNGKIRSLSPR